MPASSTIIESPWLAPATLPGIAGASALATMSMSSPRWEKYHWQAAGATAPKTDPSRTWTVIGRKDPPLPGTSGLTSSLYPTRQADTVWDVPQLIGPVVWSADSVTSKSMSEPLTVILSLIGMVVPRSMPSLSRQPSAV